MRWIVSIGFLLLAIVAHAEEQMTMDVQASQKHFEIIFPANSTTGYQWTVEHYDITFLKLLKSEYVAPKTHLKGAGGMMIYWFEIIPGKVRPAQTEILFKYSQPWEEKKGAQKRVLVHFQS